jgi:hypothetical protein
MILLGVGGFAWYSALNGHMLGPTFCSIDSHSNRLRHFSFNSVVELLNVCYLVDQQYRY